MINFEYQVFNKTTGKIIRSGFENEKDDLIKHAHKIHALDPKQEIEVRRIIIMSDIIYSSKHPENETRFLF